jgi:hypothetical protein
MTGDAVWGESVSPHLAESHQEQDDILGVHNAQVALVPGGVSGGGRVHHGR